MDAKLDQGLEKAQAALLAHYAPDARVRRVRWSQGEIQLFELGEGPPLLLVHGGGDGAFVWMPILSALARNRRVLVVDRPGHGLADPFDYRGVDLLDHARTFVRDILDALDLPTVDIAANSIGGLVATAFALDNPERVSRLVLVGAPMGVARDAPSLLRLMSLPFLGQALGRLMMRNPTRDGSRKFWGLLQVAHPERLEDVFLDVDVAHTRRNLDSILSLIRCVGHGIRGGQLVLGDRWQKLKVPTSFLGAARDVFVRPKYEKELQAIVEGNPNVRLLRIPRAGHLPWLDEPELVVAEIERFLATPPRSEAETALNATRRGLDQIPNSPSSA